MKNKKSTAISLVAILVVSLFAACAGPVQAGVITLNWVSFRPSNHGAVISIRENFFDKITERTGGRVVIEYRGGPEVMTAADLGIAVSNGTVDIADLFMGAYAPVVPGIGGASLTQFSPAEERANGAFEFMSAMHEKAGIKYLGRPAPQEINYFYTWIKGSKKPETKADISALRIGTAAGSMHAVSAWGVNPTMVQVPENFEALQSGIVDAIAGQPSEGAIANGWDALCNYAIDHPYFQSTALLIMNLNKWNSFPDDIKQIIMECVVEGENAVLAIRHTQEMEYRKVVESKGVEYIKLPPDVADWYLTQAYEGSWAAEIANYPDVAPKLKELLSR